MSWSDQLQTRFEDLLADEALFGLDSAEHDELQKLVDDAPDSDDAVSFANLAAEVLLAQHDESNSDGLSTALRQNLDDDAEAFFDKPANTSNTGDAANFEIAKQSENKRSRWREGVAWLVAAACLLLAWSLWRPESTAPSLAEQRTQLIASADDLIKIAWLPSKDPSATDAKGDVVWSSKLQQGFLRFRGLNANDPAKQQYQLWIIDGKRDAAQPVDGGVFDIPAGQDEVLIPIDAKLKVYDPKAFAITIEKPGGVVVSKRERLPLLAAVDG